MTTASHITLPVAAITAAVAFVVFSLFYQLLFFTFSEATPGMRYARIGLCTLSDDNPTAPRCAAASSRQCSPPAL